jgi:hypothetical protein
VRRSVMALPPLSAEERRILVLAPFPIVTFPAQRAHSTVRRLEKTHAEAGDEFAVYPWEDGRDEW